MFNFFKQANKLRTLLDEVQEVGGRVIVRGYRKIASDHKCAPTAKTTDQKIMEIYSSVGTAFGKIAEQRGERIPALVQNNIVMNFLQVYEKMGEKLFQDHLQYEVEKYLREGLRPDYQHELQLFDPNGNDPDVKRLGELQRIAQEKSSGR